MPTSERYVRKPCRPFTQERKDLMVWYLRGDHPDRPDLGGKKVLCAEAVGVNYSTVCEHLNKDPDFAAAWQEAFDAYVEQHYLTALHKRAVEGVLEPVLGGKYRDQVVAHRRVYSDSLMSMALKAWRQEFRGIDGPAGTGGTGGILLVPVAPATVEDWEAQFGNMARALPPPKDDGD